MKSITQLLIALCILALNASAFTPVTFVSRSTTAVHLFGGKKKPAAPAGGKGKDASVFGGKGARITVREDEDAAMWIEEPKDKDKKKPAPKKWF